MDVPLIDQRKYQSHRTDGTGRLWTPRAWPSCSLAMNAERVGKALPLLPGAEPPGARAPTRATPFGGPDGRAAIYPEPRRGSQVVGALARLTPTRSGRRDTGNDCQGSEAKRGQGISRSTVDVYEADICIRTPQPLYHGSPSRLWADCPSPQMPQLCHPELKCANVCQFSVLDPFQPFSC